MSQPNEIIHTWHDIGHFIDDAVNEDPFSPNGTAKESFHRYHKDDEADRIAVADQMKLIDTFGREIQFPIRLVATTKIMTMEEAYGNFEPPTLPPIESYYEPENPPRVEWIGFKQSKD